MDKRRIIIDALGHLVEQAKEKDFGYPLSITIVDQLGTCYYCRFLDEAHLCETSTSMPDKDPDFPVFYLCTNGHGQALSGRIDARDISFVNLTKYPIDFDTVEEQLNALLQMMTAREIRELRALPYEDFLLSEYWLIVSGYIKERDKACRMCYSKTSLQVHHLTYAHKGEEFRYLNDLVTLCSTCHTREHGIVDEMENRQ